MADDSTVWDHADGFVPASELEDASSSTTEQVSNAVAGLEVARVRRHSMAGDVGRRSNADDPLSCRPNGHRNHIVGEVLFVADSRVAVGCENVHEALRDRHLDADARMSHKER